ncbi:MAG: ABC transporter ATP-binding protein [Proteobacteria bacterium]|nr:ABC transporter ATP-binding protein [Pseudomonadota bacterium]
MASPNAPVLELDGLSKTYGGGVAAVQGVSLSVGAGEVYGFLGPNGAGKSTTIRMLLGLIAPTGGAARLWGHDVRRHKAVLSRVGSLVDGGTFYPFMTGRGNLEVLGRTQGRHDPDRAQALLAQVGLADAADRKVKGYSTGMRQRLGVAAALLNDPDLVILDEPANGLDAAGIGEMRALIQGLSKDQGKTVFLCSHLLHEVEQVCDRVAIVDRGRVIREAAVGELTRSDAVVVETETPEAGLMALGGRWPAAVEAGRLVVQAGREEIPALVQALVGAGVPVFGVAAERRSLESAFLTITGEAGHA